LEVVVAVEEARDDLGFVLAEVEATCVDSEARVALAFRAVVDVFAGSFCSTLGIAFSATGFVGVAAFETARLGEAGIA
jgi:hypothetical protein